MTNINDIIKPLNRIADTLDEVLTLVKKDENFNYSQLELPFPEVE